MSSHSSRTVRVAHYVTAFAVAALSIGAAHAGDVATATVPPQTVVKYADLDLSKDADVRALYARLQRASARVCGEYKDLRNLSLKRRYDACYQESLARAVDNVGHPSVKAVFAADERVRMAERSSNAAAST